MPTIRYVFQTYIPALIAQSATRTLLFLLRLTHSLGINFFYPYHPPSRRIRIKTSSDRPVSLSLLVHEPLGYDLKTEGPLPLHLNFHGSGFVTPLLESDSEFCHFLANSDEFRCIVIDCDYSKAPQHPFPTQIEQVKDILLHVISRPDLYDPDKISIGGFSAGANLSISVAGNMTERDEQRGIEKGTIKAVLAFYPPVKLGPARRTEVNPKAKEELGKNRDSAGVILKPLTTGVFDRSYMNDRVDKLYKDPRISVGNIPPSALPPTLMVNCEYDTLFTDAEVFADELVRSSKAEGRKDGHEKFVVRRQGHAWDKMTRKGGLADKLKWDSYRAAAEMLARVHRGVSE